MCANNRLRCCSQCCTTCNVGPLLVLKSACFFTKKPSVDVFPRILACSPSGHKRHRFSFDFSVNHLGVFLHCETQVKLKSLRLSLSKTFCFLFSVLSYAERSFLSIWISLYFVMQSSCCFCGVFLAFFATGTSTVVSLYWSCWTSAVLGAF